MKIFKLNKILVLFLVFSFISVHAESKVLKPVNAKSKTVILISGKARDYYSVGIRNASLIEVKGPGKLKIISRPQFKQNYSSTISYKIFYRIDGGDRKSVQFDDVQKSTKAKYKVDTLSTPGDEGEITINLGSGEHNIKVWIENDNPKVDARYIFTPKEEKELTWISINPLEPNEPVNLLADEEEVKYYRFSEANPLKIKITGPTKLRLLSRIENHYTMKGRINYRIEVKEDKKVKHTYQLNSIRSETTCYKKDGSKIPGKAKEIVFNVPKGTHYYQITPLDKDKSTVLGRVLFPKKDIKLGEK
ncbi:MAG: hypothetical protein IPM56_08255 [Ignavibacteriales bacterium]|nr:MAG: hypothetical protein IPM56_08255 [Ignavibacteriales bacterium]